MGKIGYRLIADEAGYLRDGTGIFGIESSSG